MSMFRIDYSAQGTPRILEINACGDVLSQRELPTPMDQLVQELCADFTRMDTGKIHDDAQPAIYISARELGVEITSLETVVFTREELEEMVGESAWAQVCALENELFKAWEAEGTPYEIEG